MELGSGPLCLYAACKGAAVIAFECDPVAIQRLKENLSLNPGLSERVILKESRTERSRCSTRSARLRLRRRRPRHRIGLRVTTSRYQASKGTARVFEEAGWLNDPNALIKIDTEGAEASILSSLGSLVRDAACSFYISFHPFYLFGKDARPDRLIRTRATLDWMDQFWDYVWWSGHSGGLNRIDKEDYLERAMGGTWLPAILFTRRDDLDDLGGEGGAITSIVEATYGSGDDVVDVTARLQDLVRNGHLHITVSNTLFGDPCPNRLKTLRFTYELSGNDQQYRYQVEEHQNVFLPNQNGNGEDESDAPGNSARDGLMEVHVSDELQVSDGPGAGSGRYPVFIVCRDRLTPLLELISWLERVGQDEIYLVDNDSSYPPLLQYYRETKHQVVFLKENWGNTAVWRANLITMLGVTGKFIVSDPDVVPTEDCPDDAIDILSDVLDRFPDRVKAGFGIRIDDLPDHYPLKPKVLAWEKQFWTNEIAPGLYDADIDTTFALYRAGVPWSYGPSVRTGPPYLIRHTPWYVHPAHLSAEEAFYLEHADPAIHTWRIPTSIAEPFPQHDSSGDEATRIAVGAFPDRQAPVSSRLTSLATGQDVSLPLVSCICPTYGRPPEYQHLLEEAIESFLRQTYPNKELIVLNHCPEQELVCDAPGVRVVNVPERFPSLGDKYNAAIALAHGELIAPWEDDDLSLPWRLSLSIERLGDEDYFNPKRYWFLDGAGFHYDHPMGYGHNLSLFTRAAFEAAGGYPASSGPQDAEMDAALRSTVACVGDGARGEEILTRDEWYSIYRWGVSPSHLSAYASPERDFYKEFGTQPVRPVVSFYIHAGVSTTKQKRDGFSRRPLRFNLAANAAVITEAEFQEAAALLSEYHDFEQELERDLARLAGLIGELRDERDAWKRRAKRHEEAVRELRCLLRDQGKKKKRRKDGTGKRSR